MSLLSIPRGHVVNVYLKPGEVKHLTLTSDLHTEDPMCDLQGLSKMFEARQKLAHHSAISIGDLTTLIGHNDTARFRPPVANPLWATKEAWVDEAIAYTVEHMTKHGTKWDMVSPGNHEDEWLKRHNTDVTTRIADRLGCPRGGYSGFVDYRLIMSNTGGPSGKKDKHTRVRVLYHHGAWGGKANKGYTGARDFANQRDDWQIFAYGHNHHCRLDPETRIKMKNGKENEYPVYLVNCSSWQKSYTEDARVTTYAERRGFPRAIRKAPLVRMWFEIDKNRVIQPHYTVEV